MSDHNSNKTGVRRVSTKQTSHYINSAHRNGLLERKVIEFTQDADGWKAFVEELTKSGSNQDRAAMYQLIEYLEVYAREVATESGCRSESTLDTLETVETEDGVTTTGHYWAGTEAKEGTPFYFAYRLEFRMHKIRQDIQKFEDRVEDAEIRDMFYQAMCNALALSDELWLLRTVQLERAVLIGQNRNFTGNSKATLSQQKEAAQRVRQLMTENPSLKITPTQRNVGQEYGVDKITVSRWMEKWPSEKK